MKTSITFETWVVEKIAIEIAFRSRLETDWCFVRVAEVMRYPYFRTRHKYVL